MDHLPRGQLLFLASKLVTAVVIRLPNQLIAPTSSTPPAEPAVTSSDSWRPTRTDSWRPTRMDQGHTRRTPPPVHLPLGALLSPCTVCGTGTDSWRPTRADSWRLQTQRAGVGCVEGHGYRAPGCCRAAAAPRRAPPAGTVEGGLPRHTTRTLRHSTRTLCHTTSTCIDPSSRGPE